MATTKTTERYIEAIGRRKTATARVRITPATKTEISIGEKPLAEYFSAQAHQKTILDLFDAENGIGDYTVTVHVYGGGLSAQSEAIRLGVARALVKEKADRRGDLKKAGYLRRDPRSKERKKFGLLKARKRPQWSKR